MRASILRGLTYLAIVLLVSGAFAVVYSRANDEFRRGMMGDSHHRGEGMHGMTDETHGQCETTHGSTNSTGHMSNMHGEQQGCSHSRNNSNP